MGFIDKKCRVIDTTLTNYGRELLSKGLLSAKFFTLSDFEASYYYTDSEIEELPVFECFSDDIDLFREFRLIDSEVFKEQYPVVSLVSTASLEIKRTTDENFDTDPIISYSETSGSVISSKGVESRVSSLSTRGTITDISSSIAFNRSYTDKDANYLVTVEVSSSDQRYFLHVSSSYFGLSEDATDTYNMSSEKNIAKIFYPIVRIK